MFNEDLPTFIKFFYIIIVTPEFTLSKKFVFLKIFMLNQLMYECIAWLK